MLNIYNYELILQDASTAISLVIIGTVMLVTVFLPKMHTISQQSKFRNGSKESVELKLM